MGLLAIGTSCLAEVYVMGRSRVPRPPERINPFISQPIIAVLPCIRPGIGVILRLSEDQEHEDTEGNAGGGPAGHSRAGARRPEAPARRGGIRGGGRRPRSRW